MEAGSGGALPVGERLRAVEVRLDQADSDRSALRGQIDNAWTALRKMEQSVEQLLEQQRQMHRANDERLRRVALAIQWGGLAMSFGLVALAAVQIFLSTHN